MIQNPGILKHALLYLKVQEPAFLYELSTEQQICIKDQNIQKMNAIRIF